MAAVSQAARASKARLRGKPAEALVSSSPAAGSRWPGSQADGTEGAFKVLEALRLSPGAQTQMSRQTGEKRSVVAQLEGAEQVVVAQEHEGEGGLIGQIEAEEESHFLQGGVGEVLSLVEHDDESAVLEFGEGAFQSLEVALATKAGGFAELGDEGGQEAGATQGGLGEGDDGEQTGIEGAQPPAGEGTLADAIGTAEQEGTLEGGSDARVGDGRGGFPGYRATRATRSG